MKRPLLRGAVKAEILAAARRFSGFHNQEPETVSVEKISTTAFLLGNVVSIAYEVVENGKTVVYNHDFDSPPGLAITHDGRQAIILTGEWSFTKRGFEG